MDRSVNLTTEGKHRIEGKVQSINKVHWFTKHANHKVIRMFFCIIHEVNRKGRKKAGDKSMILQANDDYGL
ncbi:hypothetical protein [Paenibacillus xylanilyticus]|uniref:hypothetical protein n=1 Tax=Paenibacillus xylanilyticus TaxID=248903 RepID=UPI00399F2370